MRDQVENSTPLILSYERLVKSVNESIARKLGYLAGVSEIENIDEVFAIHEAEIGKYFDEEICGLLGALSISRCHIIIEARDQDGLGPDHAFPWENSVQKTFDYIGGSRKLEIIRKPIDAQITNPELDTKNVELAA